MLFPSRLFPSPLAVGAHVVDLALNGKLLPDLGKTLSRAAVAFVVAMALFLWLVDKTLEFTLYDLILGWNR